MPLHSSGSVLDLWLFLIKCCFFLKKNVQKQIMGRAIRQPVFKVLKYQNAMWFQTSCTTLQSVLQASPENCQSAVRLVAQSWITILDPLYLSTWVELNKENNILKNNQKSQPIQFKQASILEYYGSSSIHCWYIWRLKRKSQSNCL